MSIKFDTLTRLAELDCSIFTNEVLGSLCSGLKNIVGLSKALYVLHLDSVKRDDYRIDTLAG